MTTRLPDIAVLSHKRVPGLAVLAEVDPQKHRHLEVAPLDEALAREWDTDAHFVCYRPRNERGEPEDCPRLNKTMLPELRLIGWDIVVSTLVLDYDNPGHAPWTPEALLDFVTRIDRLADSDKPHAGLLRSYTAFYTTRHGARFVFVLEQAVPADEAERRLSTLITRFHALGVEVDTSTKDWTRLFRLPKVVREDGLERTWEQDYFLLDVEPSRRLSLDSVPPAAEASSPSYIARLDADQPDPEEAEALLWVTKDNRRVRSEWFSQTAKTYLRGRDCYGCIFDAEPLASVGARNPTIIKYAGQVVSLLFRRAGTTPQKCYALLAPAVAQLEGEDGGRSWLDTLWHGIKLAWEREAGKAKQAERAEQVAEVERKTGAELLLQGVREWCAPLVDRETLDDNEKLWEWVSRRMILNQAGIYYTLRPDGYYQPTPVRKDLLPAHLRGLGMDQHLDFWVEVDAGDEVVRKERQVAKILSDHAAVVAGVRGRANVKGGVLEPQPHGDPYLVIGIFALRTDLPPRYDKDVDEWIRACCPDDAAYRKLCNWIGHALDFSRPISALSIVGKAGCGKKMLVRGLAECITTRALADGDEMVSDYQYSIGKSPFVVVNEAFPRGRNRDAADMFRRWTGGDPILLNAKFQIPVELQSPLRVILTANNRDVIHSLASARTLSLEDRDALAVRITHIEFDEGCADWLARKGGREFTDGWIDGDDGSRGKERVAAHFMWLHANRTPAPPGNRLLVQGDLDAEIVREIAFDSGALPDVSETLVKMIESKPEYVRDGLAVDEDTASVYATANGILEFWNRTLAGSRKGRGGGMHYRSIAQALRLLTSPGWDAQPRALKCVSGQMRRVRWSRINLPLLLLEAEKLGLLCDRLVGLVEKQRAMTAAATRKKTA